MKGTYLLLIVLFAADVFAGDTTLYFNRWSPTPVAIGEWKNFSLSLGGNWAFNPAPAIGFEKATTIDASWKSIEVPGEWVMQGFRVEKGKWAGYASLFTVPENWQGNRLKLRCEAIYSESEIYIDGKKAGYHLGGFTPFEIDITPLVTPGKAALIVVKVRNESTADAAANGTMYAVHPLGGITRNINIIALPPVNISSFHAATSFDKNYSNASLKTEVEIANESDATVKDISLLFELVNRADGAVVFSNRTTIKDPVAAAATLKKTFDFLIPNPLKWDPEHPNLYTYRLTLKAANKTEITERRIGFRQIEVRGNQVFVNNHPIKLRGVCRHEIMPLRGRSTLPGIATADVNQFRNGNVNYIRTSHYPPPEELVAACDSLGMFLEVEAPFCWADRNPIPIADSVMVLQTQTLDMVNYYKSQPSVLMWSMGNESNKFKDYFSATAAKVKILDPTRPRIFSQWGPDADGGALEITNHHYPGPPGPDQYKNASRPTVFDEYVHVNAYNRLELVTDPGIRDAWGIGFAAMWDRMYQSKGVLGGAIWGGIDDTFVIGDTTAVGYGTWGVIDGWRREKPEYWHMKKAYSPVRIKQKTNWQNNEIVFTIENRHLFSNTSECKIQWQMGRQAGTISPSIAPGETATIPIPCLQPATTDELAIKVYDPRGVLVDEYVFKNILPSIRVKTPEPVTTAVWKYSKRNGQLSAKARELELKFNTVTGDLQIFSNGQLVCDGLATLMVLPLNGEGDGVQMTGKSQQFPAFTATATDRLLQNITYEAAANVFTLTLEETFTEAKGSVTYAIKSDGNITVHYQYSLLQSIHPRQWGLVFKLPETFNSLSWERQGLWNYYPDNHIGRLQGTAQSRNANPVSGAAGPLASPKNQWSEDQNQWGTNDFRSAKMNIVKAALSDKKNTLTLISDGTQHIRAWVEANRTKLLVAQYSNLGTETYFRDHAKLFDKPLKPGDEISGTIHFSIQ